MDKTTGQFVSPEQCLWRVGPFDHRGNLTNQSSLRLKDLRRCQLPGDPRITITGHAGDLQPLRPPVQLTVGGPETLLAERPGFTRTDSGGKLR